MVLGCVGTRVPPLLGSAGPMNARDEWLEEGRRLVVLGRQIVAREGLLILCLDSWRYMVRSRRWIRTGRKHGWTA